VPGAEAVAVPVGVRGEEVEVELVGVGFCEAFALDGVVLTGEVCGAGGVCAGEEGAAFGL